MTIDAYASGARWYDLATGWALRAVRRRLVARIVAFFAEPGPGPCAEPGPEPCAEPGPQPGSQPGIQAGARRVLDIGCGTGALVLALLEKGLDAAGADISPAMLAEAAKRVPRERLSLSSGLSLPYGDGSFDATVLSLVLHESASKPEHLLAEALRVAPQCFVVEWRMPERNLDLLVMPLVHAIERIAGKEHYANFKRFARGGYLRGVAARTGALVENEEILQAGSLVLAKVSRNPNTPLPGRNRC